MLLHIHRSNRISCNLLLPSAFSKLGLVKTIPSFVEILPQKRYSTSKKKQRAKKVNPVCSVVAPVKKENKAQTLTLDGASLKSSVQKKLQQNLECLIKLI